MTLQQKLLFRILGLILFIFTANVLASQFYWYSLVWWFDMPMHFLGGIWLGLASLFVYKFRRTTANDIEHPRNLMIVGLFAIFAIGSLWEVFEFIVKYYTKTDIANLVDSASDLFFDMAGGLAACLYFICFYGRAIHKESNV